MTFKDLFASLGLITCLLALAGELGIGHFTFHYGAKPMCPKHEIEIPQTNDTKRLG